MNYMRLYNSYYILKYIRLMTFLIIMQIIRSIRAAGFSWLIWWFITRNKTQHSYFMKRETEGKIIIMKRNESDISTLQIISHLSCCRVMKGLNNYWWRDRQWWEVSSQLRDTFYFDLICQTTASNNACIQIDTLYKTRNVAKGYIKVRSNLTPAKE